MASARCCRCGSSSRGRWVRAASSASFAALAATTWWASTGMLRGESAGAMVRRWWRQASPSARNSPPPSTGCSTRRGGGVALVVVRAADQHVADRLGRVEHQLFAAEKFCPAECRVRRRAGPIARGNCGGARERIRAGCATVWAAAGGAGGPEACRADGLPRSAEKRCPSSCAALRLGECRDDRTLRWARPTRPISMPGPMSRRRCCGLAGWMRPTSRTSPKR